MYVILTPNKARCAIISAFRLRARHLLLDPTQFSSYTKTMKKSKNFLKSATARIKSSYVAALTAIKAFFTHYKFLLKPTLIFTAIYCIGLLAVFRADFNYIDDLGRSLEGYSRWGESFSRYVSDFLSTFIHTNSHLADISPLTQIIAAFLMGLASAISVHVITGAKKFKIRHYIAAIPIGLSPYFLECYSYKFDSPYMALSVLSSVAPFLFLRYKSRKPFYVATFVFALIMCNTYQAASGIFVILLLLLTLKDYLGKDAVESGPHLAKNNQSTFGQVFKALIVAVIPYAVGLLVYQVFIAKPVNDYVSTTLPPLLELPQTIVHNLLEYYRLVWFDFNFTWTLLIGLVVLIFVILVVAKSKRHKVASLLLVMLFLATTAVGSFGIYPALTDPLTDPRAMYGICICFGFICIYTVELATGRYIKFLRLPAFAISWCFFVFAFTYGNSLNAQLEYANFRMEQTLTTLSANNVITDDTEYIYIENIPDFAPAIRENVEQYPILSRLVPKVYYGGGHVWGYYKLLHYYDLDMNFSQQDNTCISANSSCEVIETMYETIRFDKFSVYVFLK